MEISQLFLDKMKIFYNSFLQAKSKILYSIFGNLFPLILGPLVLFFIKEDFKISDLLGSQNLIIYSATFAISSLFIWKNNSNKKKDLEGMLFYIFLILIITVLFSVSYIDYFHKEIFDYVTKFVFFLTIILYSYQEIKTVYYINKNRGIREFRNDDIRELEDEFDNLNDDEDGR